MKPSRIAEILNGLAAGERGWIHDQLDGTSFIKDALDEVDKSVEEAEQALLQWHESEMKKRLEEIIEVINGNRIDREATRKHMESKDATEQQILSMDIEADDLDDTIDKIIKDVRHKAGIDAVASEGTLE